MAKNNYDPVGTLSVGNVVTTGTTIYKSNFKRYFLVSLRAVGWSIAMGFAAVGFAIIGGILYGITKSWLIAIPLVVGWIAVTLYFLARYATERAIICRLAYQELIEAPETTIVATQQLLPRTWGFLRLSWLVGLYLSLVAMISSFALSIVLFAVVAAIIYLFKIVTPDPATSIVIGLLTIGLFLLWIAVLIRYYAYWFVAELPMAVESTTSASVSIRRSKQLTTTAARRISLTIAMAFLITIPISLLGNVPSVIGQIMSNPAISRDPSTQSMGAILILVGFALSLLGELFVMPFWQTIKAIVYYDLRNRREGGDLIL
ncbi:hypothetical protein [Chamaesiphon sp. VAR_48_metabat_135_sub]|uniref:hypothetical protein n=1 Tax=Chamaesiphon sp. VAR_48_metabat_135_sub TaxID=2964699 RepID=UPI00286D59E5|nr:hypothetical protein [Chamaesiphon sp. VAR_48_metabat_135_sub]